VHTFETITRKISTVLASTGAIIALLIIAFTITNIMVRFFYQSIEGSTAIIGLSLVFIICWGLAHTEMVHSNIQVDALLERLPKRTQAVIDSITGLLSLGIFSLLTWGSAMYAWEEWISIHESIPVINVPAFPFRFALVLGFAVLCLAVLLHMLEKLVEVFKK
jgi:TRAP-type C4-dicarboxylate transport system permease small subunit